MLADDHGPFFARLDVLGQAHDAPGVQPGPDVEHHLVADPLRFIVDLARARGRRQERVVEPADRLVAEDLPVLLCIRGKSLRGAAVRLVQEPIVANRIRASLQKLDVRHQLLHLPLLPRLRMERFAAIEGHDGRE